ncbi:hypothetical protein G7046_g661 [Stylonectria norvegica]|nr:hypothetical protein G7046_g661 [Stylonectria norvegica]
MSTSTPMQHVASQQGRTPSQQGRTPSQLAAATPPVSTPFSNPAHAVFSPRGPRSSPQQFKKSPAASTLMNQPQGAPLNFDSPSTAAAMGALGIGAGLDMGLDQVGVGGLGSLGAMGGEDDKMKRLEDILAIMNKKKGLVSEAGLERLAQRVGLDFISEEQTGANGRKKRTLVIAGSAIQLDIDLDNNIVEKISLAFPESSISVTRHVDAANQILLKDLKLLPNQSPLTKTLDEFAANLERLATLDKLSIIPGLDCHEALAGIYVSLEKLHQWDIARLREEPGMGDKPNSVLSAIAMCTKHGYPVMHSRGRVGLALQYWRERRLVPPANEKMASFAAKEEKVWSLLIGCAAIDGLLPHPPPPVKVSENWISKEIIVQDEPSMDPKKPILDWQEPENLVLPPSEDNKDAGRETLQPDLSTARVPEVMFTVSFDPPVILPQNDWIRLHAYAAQDAPPVFGYPPTFDSLFFPVPPGSPQDPSELRAIHRQRSLRVIGKDGKVSTTSHRNSLFIYKQIYSQVVTGLSFSHPRQLINMLSLLRQYAFISTLLENSFGSQTKELVKETPSGPAATTGPKTNTITTKDELLNLQIATTTKVDASSEESLEVDVNLVVHPTPHLTVVFPFRDSTANIAFKILDDGVVEITDENVIPTEGDRDGGKWKGKEVTRADLGRLLELMEDICKWAEWICTRLA